MDFRKVVYTSFYRHNNYQFWDIYDQVSAKGLKTPFVLLQWSRSIIYSSNYPMPNDINYSITAFKLFIMS